MKRIAALAVLLGLLLSGCSLLQRTPKSDQHFTGETLDLARAIERGDNDRVRDLIDAGADVEATGDDERTLLHWAVVHSNLEATEALLGAGADPDRISLRHTSALHEAAGTHGDRGTALVTVLLDAGANPNLVSPGTGAAPLPNTCRASNLASLEALLGGGAEPDHTDLNRGVALHTCARTNQGAMLLRLLEAGADPGLQTSGGATFQDYYYSFPADVLNDRARDERSQVAAWLVAHGHELTPEAEEWL